MSGMNLTTGRAVADLDHLRQSIRDILTTPIGRAWSAAPTRPCCRI